MKKQIISLLVTAMMVSSCQLDETVYSSIYTANFYKTASDAEAAITAAYDPIADMYAGPAPILVGDGSADQCFPRVAVARNTLTLFTYDTYYSAQKTAGRTNESPLQIWISAYDGIEKANRVIENVPGATMDAARKREIIGEAFFLRAFYHWMATKNFGDVIIKIKASTVQGNAYATKSAKTDVYKQIYLDLDSAVDKLPAATAGLVKGRASKEAALTLYAKAALYNEDWATATAKAQLVLTSGYVALMPNVLDVYNYATEDAARTENLFAFESESNTSVSGSTTSRAHQMPGLCGPSGSAAPAYATTSFGSFFAYESFYESFTTGDKRKQLLDTFYINKAGATVHQANITPITKHAVLIKKYQDPISISGCTNNVPIFRLADVYLIGAEAEVRLHGVTALATSYLNAIRDRAGLAPVGALTDNAFIAEVLQQRAWEFFGEGDRWYDLTRTNTFLDVIPLAVNDYYPVRTPAAKNKYFPIPQDEINANPGLQQNPDWQ